MTAHDKQLTAAVVAAAIGAVRDVLNVSRVADQVGAAREGVGDSGGATPAPVQGSPAVALAVTAVVTDVSVVVEDALEVARQRAVEELRLLDTPYGERFDRITRLAKELFKVEFAGISLMDHDRQWYKWTSGVAMSEMPRGVALCEHTLTEPSALIVRDATIDPRFQDHVLVVGQSHVRFYAGYPLEAPGGERLGAICLIDSLPRSFSPEEEVLLRDLAVWVQNDLYANQELDRAAEVQRGLLPKKLVSLPGFEVAGGCAPALAVGGDFYDWYPVGEGAAFTLADVMGKGIGAAILAATVRAMLRAGSRLDDIRDVVQAAATTLEPDLEEAGSFVTLFHARLDMDTGVVRYIDAGHGLSLLLRADGTSERLATSGLPLGAEAEQEWIEESVQLGYGDVLVSVSDGVLDLFDGTLGALDKVAEIVRAAESAQAAIDQIMSMAGLVATDDVTVIVVSRTERRAGRPHPLAAIHSKV
ncbi:PP2C family protein-serine/threonine phosphatase [Cryobacterium sp. M91]|uniref:PP2C family protein-serine/threonine phosphatase n=1 Tax=Cryobacterium sp. M91 TaxID=2048294 RepID=UPI001E5982DA|nr:SpoIIE family protein phosphatase [Cryobacterium sp. M91]